MRTTILESDSSVNLIDLIRKIKAFFKELIHLSLLQVQRKAISGQKLSVFLLSYFKIVNHGSRSLRGLFINIQLVIQKLSYHFISGDIHLHGCHHSEFIIHIDVFGLVIHEIQLSRVAKFDICVVFTEKHLYIFSTYLKL